MDSKKLDYRVLLGIVYVEKILPNEIINEDRFFAEFGDLLSGKSKEKVKNLFDQSTYCHLFISEIMDVLTSTQRKKLNCVRMNDIIEKK